MKRKAAPSFATRAAVASAPLRARWAALSPRERYLSTLAASAVGLLLVWAIALAPALRTLEKVKTQRVVLDGQLQQMLALQAEARQLAAQPRIGREVALKALQESIAGLGSGAQMQVSGERAVVTLRGIPAARVAAWLGEARANARVIPVETRLVRSAARAPAAATPAGAAVQRPVLPSPAEMNNVPPPGFSGAPPMVAPAAAPVADDVRWDGTMVLVLPPA